MKMTELWVIEVEHRDYWSTYDTSPSYGAALTRLAQYRSSFDEMSFRLVRLTEKRLVVEA